MKKNGLTISLLLALSTTLLSPLVNANTLTITKPGQQSVPGVSISHPPANPNQSGVPFLSIAGPSTGPSSAAGSNPRNQNSPLGNVGSSEGRASAPPSPSDGGNMGGFTGAKPVNVPTVEPKPQVIMPQSLNDMEQTARKVSQGQVAFEPPTIVRGSLQDWNTSTIREQEAKGRAEAQKNYEIFRNGRR